MGQGTYASLLGFNVISTICCWGLGALAFLDNIKGRELVKSKEEELEENGNASREMDIEILDGKLPVVDSKDHNDGSTGV